ncbi:MAG TPA: SGNH/GDSL hydrolase family protein [Thermoleophilia bacterium]|nr:SGNH/GDSL hydrolase family protein [Thermoleophilia bacterium]
MNSFKRGFRFTSPLVLVVAALLVLPVLYALQASVTSGRWSALPLERCLRIPQDADTYVSWVVGKAKRQPPDGPVVYLLGGSAAREAIVSGKGLAADVAALGGPAITAYDLGTNNQNFAESMAVVDNVPETSTWVLIGVNPGRFTNTPSRSADQLEGRELLLESSALRTTMAEKWGKSQRIPTILPGVLAYLTDLSQRRMESVFNGKKRGFNYQQHTFYGREALSDKEKNELVERWLENRPAALGRYVDRHLQILDGLLARARERGLHVVIVELPLNEDVVDGRFDSAQAEYQRPLRELARRYDVPYVDFNEELGLPSADFYDLSHLDRDGGILWQRRLAEELVRLMKQAEPAP